MIRELSKYSEHLKKDEWCSYREIKSFIIKSCHHGDGGHGRLQIMNIWVTLVM